MLLKPWVELPTPRHLLDENDDIDEKDAGFLLQYESWTRVEGAIEEGSHLLLLAPRLSHYMDAFPDSEVVGSLVCGYTKKPGFGAASVPIDDLYDHDLEQSTQEVTETLHKADIRQFTTQAGRITVIAVPLLEARDCYAFTVEVLDKVKPRRVTTVTPGNMVSTTTSNLYGLYSPEIPQKERLLPLLEPPFMISGAIASIVSRCQRQSVSTYSIVVRAEGPQGHEAIDYDSTSFDISRALEAALGLKPRSIKSRHEHERPNPPSVEQPVASEKRPHIFFLGAQEVWGLAPRKTTPGLGLQGASSEASPGGLGACPQKNYRVLVRPQKPRNWATLGLQGAVPYTPVALRSSNNWTGYNNTAN
ncbi:hypothetical protein TRICI_001339 [Trichomonascus ciferrii]|uniref:Proteasome assembly chaperone 1 n=1 Tax=Trichomonascus ciferrii TaxID=44093 RepID=A0A642VB01_9ASCO|nr:hypothetical protein TRICI_001339 [Trichomonascus ciferrii]